VTRGNQAGAVAAITIALAAAWTVALAQYSNSDPRSPMYQEYQRQQQEQQQEKDKADKQRREEDSARSAENMQTFMENQRKLQEKISGEVERDRALFLKTPPVPPQKNRLLGQWRLDKTKKKPANALAEINAAISQPACEMVFGEGIWDFRPKALYGIDAGIGESKLTDVDYRGNEGIIGVIPKTGKLFIFKILGPDRVQELTSTRIGADPCNFVRVGAGVRGASAPAPAPQAANPSSSGGPPAASGRAPASPPAQVASAAPIRSTLSRPSPEVCRQTLLDKLGTVGVNQVRAMSDVRFKDAAIEGKVPNTGNLRIDLRGSACDDPRIKATLYDFDADGMLQSITYVWEHPAGPAPAPIFTERVKTLSLLHSLPPPQSPSRLQADTSMGRLIVEDLPERNLLLEAYKTPK
jgi:hypothetical protein